MASAMQPAQSGCAMKVGLEDADETIEAIEAKCKVWVEAWRALQETVRSLCCKVGEMQHDAAIMAIEHGHVTCMMRTTEATFKAILAGSAFAREAWAMTRHTC
jgi:hypothetical protein